MSNINQCARCALRDTCGVKFQPQIVTGDCEGDECLQWEPVKKEAVQ